MINLEQGGWEMLLALDVGESVGGIPVACCMMKEQKQDNKEEERR